jgi:hypothetical protein
LSGRGREHRHSVVAALPPERRHACFGTTNTSEVACDRLGHEQRPGVLGWRLARTPVAQQSRNDFGVDHLGRRPRASARSSSATWPRTRSSEAIRR